MERVKYLSTLLLTLILISSSLSIDDEDDDDAVLLQEDFGTHLRSIQEDLDAAGEEFRQKNKHLKDEEYDVLASQFVDPIAEVESNGDPNEFDPHRILHRRQSLEDRKALLQHLHLIRHSNLNDDKDSIIEEAMFEDENNEDDDSSDVASEIQSLMEDSDPYENAQESSLSESMGKKKSTTKKIEKETKKILNELKPDEVLASHV